MKSSNELSHPDAGLLSHRCASQCRANVPKWIMRPSGRYSPGNRRPAGRTVGLGFDSWCKSSRKGTSECSVVYHALIV